MLQQFGSTESGRRFSGTIYSLDYSKCYILLLLKVEALYIDKFRFYRQLYSYKSPIKANLSDYGGALQKSLPALPRLTLKSPHAAENWAHSKPVLGDPRRY